MSEAPAGLFASPGKRQLVLSLALVAVTLAIYAPLRDYPFITYDDNLYVTQNLPVRTGLNWKSVAWAFTTVEVANYHPITWLSHELDVQLFGLNPAGHHLTSILLHCLNTMLLFLLLARATGSVWSSAAVAALFAIHPLNIQSVAWVSERKNLLSTFFGLATLWAYGWYSLRPSLQRYSAVLALLVLSLLSKPMLVTLPFALLLIDYWPLYRFPVRFYGNSETSPNSITAPRRTLRGLILEKIPLLAVIAMSAWVAFRAQRLYAGSNLHLLFPLRYRVQNAVYSYADYLYKLFWPNRLAIFYPHPGASLSIFQILCAVVLLAGISTGVLWRRRPPLIVGWLWYLGTLVPVIGLIQIGAQARADRYAYVPLWGAFVVLVWLVADLARKRSVRRMVSILFLAALAVLVWQSRVQLGYWRNSATLFARALEISPNNNYISQANLATSLMELGRYGEAVPHFEYVLDHFPDAASIRNDYGTDLLLMGKPLEAAQQYTLAFPAAAGPRSLQGAIKGNQGVAQEQAGDPQAAIESYREALQIDSALYQVRVSLGLLLYKQGYSEEAMKEFQESIQTLPSAMAYYGIGMVLEREQREPEAIAAYKRALQIAPEMAEAKAGLERISGTGAGGLR